MFYPPAYHDHLHIINRDPETGDISKRYQCCIYMPFTLLESSIQVGNCAIISFSPFRISLQLNKSGKAKGLVILILSVAFDSRVQL